jgi:predicted NBD/HSP70 family sugar kinase
LRLIRANHNSKIAGGYWGMPSERFTGLAAVLNAVRNGDGITQAMLVEQVGLGRSIMARRVAELEAAGLLVSDELGASTGGRAPRRLRVRAEAGCVLGVDIASHELVVGLADLAGNMHATRHEHTDIGGGPEAILALVESLGDALMNATRGPLRSVALGMPEAVAFDDGVPVALPTMPEWDRYPVRERLASRWSVPVGMDDRVNLLALGERRVNPLAGRSRHMLYVGGGAGVGAAVVADGRVYRGSSGLAGAIGHVTVSDAGEVTCGCGNAGCLEAVVGGVALSRDGRMLAETGRSPALAAILTDRGEIQPVDITRVAEQGDRAAEALLDRAGVLLGEGIAALVNAYNPDLVVIGGGIVRAGARVLDAVRESVRRHTLPAAVRRLRIELSVADEEVAGVTGAAQFALDQVFSADHLPALLNGAPRSG